MLVRRDTREKRSIAIDALRTELPVLLDQIQADMLAAARARLEANTIRERISYDRFKEIMKAMARLFTPAGTVIRRSNSG